MESISPIKGISSMATRRVLAELASAFGQRSGQEVVIESVGGVDAAKRVQAGEPFDVLILASGMIDLLIENGHLVAGSKRELLRSSAVAAVREGTPRPDLSSEEAVREAVLSARTVGYSTGPSGMHTEKLFERWGIAEQIADRIVQAPPGVPVGALVACGKVEIGFQQLSELIDVPGITVIGSLPPAIQIVTTFSAGIGIGSTQADRVSSLLDFMTSSACADVARRHGMEPA